MYGTPQIRRPVYIFMQLAVLTVLCVRNGTGSPAHNVRIFIAVKIFGFCTDGVGIHPCAGAFGLSLFNGIQKFLMARDDDRPIILGRRLIFGKGIQRRILPQPGAYIHNALIKIFVSG